MRFERAIDDLRHDVRRRREERPHRSRVSWLARPSAADPRSSSSSTSTCRPVPPCTAAVRIQPTLSASLDDRSASSTRACGRRSSAPRASFSPASMKPPSSRPSQSSPRASRRSATEPQASSGSRRAACGARRSRSPLLQLTGDPVDDMIAAQRESTVDQQGGEILPHRCLHDEERAELGVPVLLDDEVTLVRGEERLHPLVEREAPDAHVVGLDAARFKRLQALAHGAVAAAEGDDAEFPRPRGCGSPARARPSRRPCASARAGPSPLDTLPGSPCSRRAWCGLSPS